MKISLNWLKKYVKVPVTDEELIRLIGARLVEVEGVMDETHKYDNIYIVRVEHAEKIPETHLTLCQINTGKDSEVQVVCGAPNVREGMLAVWIAPGAIVPASVHEDAPFVIGKRKMRGYESNGMLAGADELDFGDDHSGIVEIDPEIAKPGDLLADVFGLVDLVLEIENKSLTHRPDCFGIIGFAREVAGILGESFADSAFSEARLEGSEINGLAIKILEPGICKRYSAIVLEKHGEVEKKYLTWVDTMLSKSGMKPIDPIVDVTNYLMLLTGQPLHAFDYDKFVAVGGKDKPEVVVRLARKGEKLVLLDEREIELCENDIVICSGDVPVALAGAMGGKSTEIDKDTRNVLLESATFSLYNLRKTQMVHGIFSDAITRFTKGQPSYQTLAVAEACANMLSDGFRVASVSDEYLEPEKDIVVKIAIEEINLLLGTRYDCQTIVTTLSNVGFSVAVSFGDGVAPARRPEVARWVSPQDEKQAFRLLGSYDGRHGRSAPHTSVVTSANSSGKATRKAYLEIHVPAWRTDIHIKEDVIEEVGRLLGFDNIEPTLPMHGTAELNRMWELKKQLRQMLAKYGANEVLTYSFVSDRLLNKAGLESKNSYKIVNSISPELQYVRQSIIPSLLDKAYLNEKLPVEKFAIFEMNKVYQKKWGMNEEVVPTEKMMLGFVVAERKNIETAFYKAKKYANKLLSELNILVDYVPLKMKEAMAKPFEEKRAAEIRVGDKCIGVVGEFKNSVRNEFKLAPYLAGFEIDLDCVLELLLLKKQIYVGKRTYEDLTVTTEKTYAETRKDVQEKYPEAVITPGTIYQKVGQKSKNMTFHIEIR